MSTLSMVPQYAGVFNPYLCTDAVSVYTPYVDQVVDKSGEYKVAAVHLWSAESIADRSECHRQRSKVGFGALFRWLGSYTTDRRSSGAFARSILSHC